MAASTPAARVLRQTRLIDVEFASKIKTGVSLPYLSSILVAARVPVTLRVEHFDKCLEIQVGFGLHQRAV